MARNKALILLQTAALAVLATTTHAQTLLAAAGKIDITPTGQVYLAGYSSNRKSTGVHDRLWARCIIIQSRSQQVAMVSCDLIGLTHHHITQIVSRVKSMPAARVVVSATHTHSGPDTYGQWGPDLQTSGLNKPWMESVYSKVSALVDSVHAKLKPAVLRFGTVDGVTDCSKNIRVAKILDTQLTAMQALDMQGHCIAALVNYACHPEILDNHQITSDFPNWLRNRLEQRLGGVAIYVNGAQGGMVTADIKNESSFPRGEAWPEAERIGTKLADYAADALAAGETIPTAPITFASHQMQVPLENPNFIALVKMGILPSDLADGGNVRTEVCRFTIGPAEFITLPGEVLPAIGLFLKSHMSGKYRFQLGLTQDALGYILTPEDFNLNLYSYEKSQSVGSQMGRIMEQNLLQLLGATPPRAPVERIEPPR